MPPTPDAPSPAPPLPDGPVSRPAQRIGGAFLIVFGVFIAYVVWTQAAETGEFLLAGSFMGPAFAMIGAGLVVWPGYREERIARGEDVSGLEGFALLTPRWRGLLVGALAAGAAYTLALESGWVAT